MIMSGKEMKEWYLRQEDKSKAILQLANTNDVSKEKIISVLYSSGIRFDQIPKKLNAGTENAGTENAGMGNTEKENTGMGNTEKEKTEGDKTINQLVICESFEEENFDDYVIYSKEKLTKGDVVYCAEEQGKGRFMFCVCDSFAAERGVMEALEKQYGARAMPVLAKAELRWL